MQHRAKSMTALGMSVSAILSVTLATAGTAYGANGSTGISPSASSAKLGVTVDADGWIHYANTIADSLGLRHMTTTTLQGKRGANGQCTFTSPKTPVSKSDSSDDFTEEIAYNPKTCQQKVSSGALTSAGKAKLAAAQPAPTAASTSRQPNAPAAQAPSAPTKAKAGASPQAPTAVGGFSAFEKVSYVDPVDITITSMTQNLNWWSNGGSIYAANQNSVPYKFWADGWSDSGVGGAWGDYLGNTWISINSYDTFYNTDFEAVVILTMGVAGYAACGFNSDPATFYLSPSIEGDINGNYAHWHDESVSGGCSDLVHFRENNGYGNSA